jgi:hypothetical protein
MPRSDSGLSFCAERTAVIGVNTLDNGMIANEPQRNAVSPYPFSP